jgi:ATP phosphoribosyltransferase
MEYVNIALPKGRIGTLSIELFEKAGIDCSELKAESRKLVLIDEKNKIKFFLVKPSDVPTYVEYGTADIGVVGKDTLLEEGRHLYEMLDLGFGACSMVVAGTSELYGKIDQLNNKRVATKYPKIAREYFEHKKNESIEIIKLNGSVELAPLVGLSEIIVDIVESGKTLKENGLVVLETITDISARLVVNRVSFKMKNDKISSLIDNLKMILEES